MLVAPASSADVNPPTIKQPNRRANKTEEGLMSRDGLLRRNERMKRVFVIKGMTKRFARASRTKALRIVEPL